ncbi:MAG: nucleotidyltransferase domain-containing protein [Nanoarchaeota archaeon]
MKYQNYIENLLGSKIEIKILRLLVRYENKEFTSRELAKLANTSHTSVLRIINNLESNNVVRKEFYSGAHKIKINKESYLYGLIKEIFNKEINTKNELVKDLRAILPKNIISAALYGSIARQEENEKSDIDLLIITNKKFKEQINNIKDKYGNNLHSIQLTLNEFKKEAKRKIGYIKDLLKDYVLIKGKDLKELI